eukprot:796334-Alexandrium_andersonii.AAC.1
MLVESLSAQAQVMPMHDVPSGDAHVHAPQNIQHRREERKQVDTAPPARDFSLEVSSRNLS